MQTRNFWTSTQVLHISSLKLDDAYQEFPHPWILHCTNKKQTQITRILVLNSKSGLKFPKVFDKKVKEFKSWIFIRSRMKRPNV